jgi:hypothetical protein
MAFVSSKQQRVASKEAEVLLVSVNDTHNVNVTIFYAPFEKKLTRAVPGDKYLWSTSVAELPKRITS